MPLELRFLSKDADELGVEILELSWKKPEALFLFSRDGVGCLCACVHTCLSNCIGFGYILLVAHRFYPPQ